MCECGHPFREHEQMEEITPCVHFTKDGRGINISICSCTDFGDAARVHVSKPQEPPQSV